MGERTHPDAWDPDRYGRFRDERRAPFLDLLELVERRPGMRVVDLGCGFGDLTLLAHSTLGAAETVGIDASRAMIERASAQGAPGLSFRVGDAGAFAERGFDLVLSNAALHWVPDHEALVPRLAALLPPGGQLAIQVPDNEQHASHATARAVAAEAPFREALGGHVRISPVLAPEAYARLLFRAGLARRRVRVEVYPHELASRAEVVEWVRGSLLTDYEKRLPPDLWARFLERYRERLFEALPDERPFLYTYRRVFVWGQLAAASPPRPPVSPARAT